MTKGHQRMRSTAAWVRLLVAALPSQACKCGGGSSQKIGSTGKVSIESDKLFNGIAAQRMANGVRHQTPLMIAVHCMRVEPNWIRRRRVWPWFPRRRPEGGYGHEIGGHRLKSGAKGESALIERAWINYREWQKLFIVGVRRARVLGVAFIVVVVVVATQC